LGPEVIHALRRFDGHLRLRLLRQVLAQVLRDRHHVPARHPQRLAGAGFVFATSFEHVGELLPRLRPWMLAAELALTVAPAAGRDHRRDALVDAPGIDGDRGADTVADHPDPRGVDFRALRQPAQRVARVGALVHAQDETAGAAAVAAAA